MSRPEKVTIVGAGLVGSLLSVMLGNLGYKVVVLEKRPDMRDQNVDSGRSINLALAERGIHALKQAGLMDKVESLLIPMKGRMLHSVDGELEYFSYGQRPDEVIYSVSRSGLNELLMDAAEASKNVELRFEQEFSAIDFDANTISIEDLRQGEAVDHQYEVLIGADGAGSRVRRAMLPLVDGNDDSELLDHDYKELTIPAGANATHQIEKEALHIWPRGGYMLIALPNLDGSFTVTLFLQKKGSVSFEALSTPQEAELFFRENFADAMALIPDLAQEFFENPTGILGTVRCSPWRLQHEVLLLGDASHAIVPFHGQGMNAGFEDCELFVDMLCEFEHDWPKTFREFDATRKDDADAIADMALENYITMRDSVRDPKFQLKKELGFELELKYPDRFIPRYSMVMFHRIPYAVAYARGKVQQSILNQLIDGKSSVKEIDFGHAGQLIKEKLQSV